LLGAEMLHFTRSARITHFVTLPHCDATQHRVPCTVHCVSVWFLNFKADLKAQCKCWLKIIKVLFGNTFEKKIKKIPIRKGAGQRIIFILLLTVFSSQYSVGVSNSLPKNFHNGYLFHLQHATKTMSLLNIIKVVN
jgi:hypothetical protein